MDLRGFDMTWSIKKKDWVGFIHLCLVLNELTQVFISIIARTILTILNFLGWQQANGATVQQHQILYSF